MQCEKFFAFTWEEISDLVMSELIFPFFLLFLFSFSIMAPLCFGSLKVNGCCDAVKRSSVFDYIVMKNGSVIFLFTRNSHGCRQSEWNGQVVLSHGSSNSCRSCCSFWRLM